MEMTEIILSLIFAVAFVSMGVLFKISADINALRTKQRTTEAYIANISNITEAIAVLTDCINENHEALTNCLLMGEIEEYKETADRTGKDEITKAQERFEAGIANILSYGTDQANKRGE